MKLLSHDFKKGFAVIIAESSDDLWELYQLLGEGDLVSGKTSRKIKVGEKEGERRPVFLKIRVEKVKFQKYADVLRVLGQVVKGPEEVPLGSYHTFNVEKGTEIRIEKPFLDYEIKRIKELARKREQPKTLLITADFGEADFFLVRPSGIQNIGRIKTEFPGKNEPKLQEQAINEFYEKLGKEIEKLVKNNSLNSFIFGGTGFLPQNFKEYYEKKSKEKGYYTKINHTGKPGVNEILKQGILNQVIKDERITMETQLVHKALELISKDGQVSYGIKEVRKAAMLGAVDKLLITDELIGKFKEENKFEEIAELMKTVEKNKGEVFIISTDHDAGEQLHKIGGIAALLRYSI